MPLPPKLVRRLTLIPAFVFVALAAMAIAPFVVVVAAVYDLIARNGFRYTRLSALAFIWCFFEVIGIFALFLLWLLSGFSLLFRFPFFLDIHYEMLGIWLGIAVWTLRKVLGMRIESEATEELPEGRVLLFARHAGPADSLLIVNGLLRIARQPRIVAKAALQWDPFIDVAANRVPFHFVDPKPKDRDEELKAIASVAGGMDRHGAFLLFPEGGNFTEGRRDKAITSLERKGLDAYAEAAKEMPYLLPPRPNGALTALAAVPDAHVVMLGHTGLEDVQGPLDAVMAVPFQNEIWVRTWLIGPDERPGPDDRDAQIEWLFEWWATVDKWIGTHRDPA